jgi:hypothetical protein
MSVQNDFKWGDGQTRMAGAPVARSNQRRRPACYVECLRSHLSDVTHNVPVLLCVLVPAAWLPPFFTQNRLHLSLFVLQQRVPHLGAAEKLPQRGVVNRLRLHHEGGELHPLPGIGDGYRGRSR